MIDRFGNDEQRQRFAAEADLDGMAGELLPDRAGLRLRRRGAEDARGRRDGGDYVLNGAKQFISGAGDSDLYVVMVRTGEDGPKGISTLRRAEGRARPLLRRQRAQDGLAHAVDPAGDLRGLPRAGGKPAVGRRRRLRHRHGRPRRRPAQHCRLFARRRAVGARQGARLCRPSARRSARRSTSSRRCSSSWPTWRPSCRRRASCSMPPPSKLDRKAPDAGKWSAMAKRFVTDTGFDVANDALQLHRRLRLSARLRHREAGARPARPPDPRRHQRDHARHHRARI